jgi:DNA processing protein
MTDRGIQVLAWYDERFPAQLKHIALPPPILFVRGQLAALRQPAIALVGTRHPSPYGIDVTRRLAGDISARGICVISGLAMGVDTVAHQTALQHSGGSIAVLPSGVDLVYPERNRQLASLLLSHTHGALVSEFYPGTKATPALFPARNRLISGLAHGVVVCEAGEQSGALITAKAALEQGREVMAVPGSIFVPQSAGCLALLRQGATPVRHVDDICESIGYQTTPYRTDVVIDPLLQLLHSPRHIDELCRITQRTTADILGDLMMRELRGEISDLGNGYYMRHNTTSSPNTNW